MNLEKLFELQKVLMERIEQEHPTKIGEDRFNKKILALLVEVGECANAWRGFKYWSKMQTPVTSDRKLVYGDPNKWIDFNPLLEPVQKALIFVKK
jgi:dimeric dUTPase (all-alpha-NTP-PPase superfamily)